MQTHQPSSLRAYTLSKPCPQCGVPTSLAKIEPAEEEGYDIRTYECFACGMQYDKKVRFR